MAQIIVLAVVNLVAWDKGVSLMRVAEVNFTIVDFGSDSELLAWQNWKIGLSRETLAVSNLWFKRAQLRLTNPAVRRCFNGVLLG